MPLYSFLASIKSYRVIFNQYIIFLYRLFKLLSDFSDSTIAVLNVPSVTQDLLPLYITFFECIVFVSG